MSTEMKGLVKDDGSRGGIFLEVKYGRICQVSKKPLPGYEPIVVRDPKKKEDITKFIVPYESVEALIVEMEWYKRRDDVRQVTYMGFKLKLNAAGVACVLDLPFKSKACQRFMKVAQNLNFTKPVEFRAWMDAEQKTAFMIKQEEANVIQYWNKDSEEMPRAVKDELNDTWDYREQEKFLYRQMTTVVIPAIKEAGNPEGKPPVKVAAVEADTSRAEVSRQARGDSGKGLTTEEPDGMFDHEGPDMREEPDFTDDDIPF